MELTCTNNPTVGWGGRKPQVLVAYPKPVSLILVHVEGGELQSCRVIPASAGIGGRPRAGQGLALGPTCAEMKVNAGMSQFTPWDGSIFQGSWIIPATQVHGAHCHGGCLSRAQALWSKCLSLVKSGLECGPGASSQEASTRCWAGTGCGTQTLPQTEPNLSCSVLVNSAMGLSVA